MKRIVNWTFGSVFRTFGRILAYFIVGLLVALIIQNKDIKLTDLLGIEKVSAATTITPSSYKHKLIYKIFNGDQIQSTEDSGWFEGDKTNFCPSGRYCTLGYDYYYITLSSSLDSGRTYTLNFNTWVTTRPTASELNKITYWVTASNTGAYNGSSPANISAFNCRTGIEEGTTTKIAFSCSITPSNAINYIYIRMNYYDIYGGSTGYGPFTSYSSNKGSIVYDNSQTDAINQQTNIIQNQTDIINNNITDSTNQIINGLDGINEANQVCEIVDKNSINITGYYLTTEGNESANNNYGITNYFKIDSTTKIKTLTGYGTQASLCFYNTNKVKLSCIRSDSLVQDTYINIPNNSSYVRFTIHIVNNKPQFEICKNGNQALNDTLTDDNTSDAQNEASSFFENFTTNTHGLTGIITAPLSAIQSLTSASCSPLVLPLPYVNEDLTLPCMRAIYVDNFGGFMTLYDAITLGIVSYWILVRIFALVKDFKNPDHDEIEVVDL